MHNGAFGNLDEVIRHYEGGGLERPSRSPMMQPFSLTDRERSELISFLEILSGTSETGR